MDDGDRGKGTGHAWGKLLRLPNLLTVPGDPIAGFALAAAVLDAGASPLHLIPAAAASLLLYCAGLVHNDLCDLSEDRRDRPTRPLPSGRISLRAARLACVLLAAGGLASAGAAGRWALAAAAILLAAILAYNRGAKRIKILGPLTMGLCRGLSLVLGAAAHGPRALATPEIAAAGGLLALYIASVTAIAAGETHARTLGAKRFLPAVIVLIWVVAVNVRFTALPILTIWIAAVQILAVQRVGLYVYRIAGRPAPATVQRTIGQLLRALLPIQASVVATAAFVAGSLLAWILALVLLAAWPAAAILSKRFYAS